MIIIRKVLGGALTKSAFIFTLALALVMSGFLVSNALALVSNIDLTSPNGSEIWSGTHDITWTAVGEPGDTVSILWSDNDFVDSSEIIAAIAYDAGSFSWDTTTVPDGTNYKIKVFYPLGGNFDASATSFEVDNTAPIISSIAFSPDTGTAKIGDAITVTIDADEDVYTPGTITVNDVDISGTFVNNFDTTYTVTYTVAGGDTDRAAGAVPVSVVLVDDADLPNSNNPFTTVDANTLAIDANVPILLSVHIQSDRLNDQYAGVGGTVTISFTSNEDVTNVVATIDGNSATVLGGPTSWTAAYTMAGGDTEGVLAFAIDFDDLATNSGLTVVATTDDTSVTFDETDPVTPLVTLLDPINSVNQVTATVSGNVVDETAGTVSVSVDDTNVGTAAITGSGSIDGSGNYSVTLNLSTLDDDTLTATVNATDLAGNTGPDGIDTATKETVIPMVNTITTKDDDGDGAVDKATIVFSEPMDDSTFLASDFTIGGSAATSIVTGTNDDDTFDVVLTTGVTGTEAKQVTYTPGTGADVNGNPLAEVVDDTVIEIDGAGPVLLSARTVTITSIEATFSEDLNGSTVNTSGSEFSVVGFPVSASTESAPGVVTVTVATMPTDATPDVTFTNVGTFRDLNPAANEAVTPITVTAVDGVAPVLTSVTIESDNDGDTAPPEWAKVGDTATLNFTASEDTDTPVATIDGQTATVLGGPSVWTATYTFTGGEVEGVIPFSIDFEDLATPSHNVGITVTATTDASEVFFDETAPLVNAGTDKEVNALVFQDAETSDPAPASGIDTWAWTQESGPGTVTFSSDATEDTDLSANTDGTYVLRLTVTDNAGNVAFHDMTLIWDTTPPEPLTSAPSDGTSGVVVIADTATVTFDEDIVLLDASRVLLENNFTFASHKGTVAVLGGDGTSPTLNIDYTGLEFGTKYRINVKSSPGGISSTVAAVSDRAGNESLQSWVSFFTTELDIIPPVVNSFSASGITTIDATLNVVTDESANCRYSVNAVSEYSVMTPFTTTGGTTHIEMLTGLAPSTGHSFYVRCADISPQVNIMTNTEVVSFTTLVEDATVPVITLLGVNPQTLTVGDTYTELGATASDDIDGDVSGSIVIDSSAVNMAVAGTYTVTYNVDDSEGNDATEETRIVIVNAAFDDTATLAVTGIDAVRTFAATDDTYTNGWSWIFHITVPTSETEFAMKFSDFLSGVNTIVAANNVRYYTAQSTEADTTGEAITIVGANAYPGNITLDSDADAGTAGRQIEVIVEMKVPVGSAGGSYSASYGVKSEI